MSGIKIFYASRNGKIITINDISPEENGNKCNCICDTCGEELIARLGNKKDNPSGHQPHFAHKGNGVTCSGERVNESALHKMAKQLIEEFAATEEVMFPQYKKIFSKTEAFLKCKNKYKYIIPKELEEKELVISEYKKTFDNVSLESNVGSTNMRADAMLASGSEEYYIEITVAHKSEPEKIKKFQEYGLTVMEIDLSKYREIKDDRVDRDCIKKKIFENLDNKKWLSNPSGDKDIEEKAKKLREEFISDKEKLYTRIKEDIVAVIKSEDFFIPPYDKKIEETDSFSEYNGKHIRELFKRYSEEKVILEGSLVPKDKIEIKETSECNTIQIVIDGTNYYIMIRMENGGLDESYIRKRIEEIKKSKFPIFTIDFSGNKGYDKETIRKFVSTDVDNKKWLFNPSGDKDIEEKAKKLINEFISDIEKPYTRIKEDIVAVIKSEGFFIPPYDKKIEETDSFSEYNGKHRHELFERYSEEKLILEGSLVPKDKIKIKETSECDTIRIVIDGTDYYIMIRMENGGLDESYISKRIEEIKKSKFPIFTIDFSGNKGYNKETIREFVSTDVDNKKWLSNPLGDRDIEEKAKEKIKKFDNEKKQEKSENKSGTQQEFCWGSHNAFENPNLKLEFIQLRNKYIEKEYAYLNLMQRNAVLAPPSPLLILAGAGSGKTTVIVEKIAYLLRFGEAYQSKDIFGEPDESDIKELEALISNGGAPSERLASLLAVEAPKPWQVLAITFTNKAAKEMQERIARSCGEEAARDIWAATFHSACVRILRRDIESLGYESNFTIYDTDDSKRVIKDAVKALNLDSDVYKPNMVLGKISSAKSEFISCEEYENEVGYDVYKSNIAQIYTRYTEALKKSNAVDFDDIINLTVKLFEQFPEKLAYWRNKFRFVLVDEYQDTNVAQFKLIYLLTKESHSVCVVGDDDQSIYKFRGATIRNILDFEKYYKDARIIRLEQNYRSTGNILNAANAVIKNNIERKGKELWTEKSDGEKISVCLTLDERGEGDYIAASVMKHKSDGGRLSDCAVLYRTNAQAAQIEQSLNFFKIPNKVIGGMKFFERKEIKDIISYLCVLVNPYDSLRLKRIINVPKRGIGDATVDTAEEISEGTGEPLIEIIRNAANYPALERSKGKLADFCATLDELSDAVDKVSFEDIAKTVAEKSGYMNMLAADRSSEGLDRSENILELGSMMIRYKEDKQKLGEEPTLSGFLEDMSLVSDIDEYERENDAVTLMTLHNAKGLEFDKVFIAGVEEELFPSERSVLEGNTEEERRLMYVGITRARKKLFLTYTERRLIYGATRFKRPSIFLEEIPGTFIEKIDTLPKRATQIQPTGGRSSYTSHPINRPRTSSYASSAASKATSVPKPVCNYSVGDNVEHKTFGKGRILSAMPMGGDILLEIEFEGVGKKKLMAKSAPMKKV